MSPPARRTARHGHAAGVGRLQPSPHATASPARTTAWAEGGGAGSRAERHPQQQRERPVGVYRNPPPGAPRDPAGRPASHTLTAPAGRPRPARRSAPRTAAIPAPGEGSCSPASWSEQVPRQPRPAGGARPGAIAPSCRRAMLPASISSASRAPASPVPRGRGCSERLAGHLVVGQQVQVIGDQPGSRSAPRSSCPCSGRC